VIGTLIRPALSQAQTGGRRTSGRPSGLVAAFTLHHLGDVIERAEQMLRPVKRTGKHAIRTKDVFA